MSQASQDRVLLAVSGFSPRRWHELLAARRTVALESDGPADPSIRYAVVWRYEHGLLKSLPHLRAIFSVGAGVDHIMADPHLPDVPVVRVVDQNLTQHMVEYVCWRVLDHHRQGMLYRAQQPRKIWHEPPQRPAPDIAVGIMGLGQLGRAAARTLKAIGFTVNGWSRRPQAVEGVTGFAGAQGLAPFLNATDILVVLLPLTAETTGIIDHALLTNLRRRPASASSGGLGGAVLINAGRGKLQRDADIVRALDDGTLKEASLDVFEQEPLPPDSPLWLHPRVFITPHAAATSDPNHLVGPMLDQMDAMDRGEAPANVVDRAAGY